MSSNRPTMSLRASSTTTTTNPSSTSTSNATTPSTNPGSPLSPPSSKDSSTLSFFSSRHTHRSQTIDTAASFFRSRSRSPRPPTDASQLKYAATSPVTPTARHSHSQHHRASVPSPPPSSPAEPRSDSFFQKKPRQSSTYGYTNGRHGNDWLFGNVSITETVKHAVSGGKRKDSK